MNIFLHLSLVTSNHMHTRAEHENLIILLPLSQQLTIPCIHLILTPDYTEMLHRACRVMVAFTDRWLTTTFCHAATYLRYLFKAAD